MGILTGEARWVQRLATPFPQASPSSLLPLPPESQWLPRCQAVAFFSPGKWGYSPIFPQIKPALYTRPVMLISHSRCSQNQSPELRPLPTAERFESQVYIFPVPEPGVQAGPVGSLHLQLQTLLLLAPQRPDAWNLMMSLPGPLPSPHPSLISEPCPNLT